MKRQLKDSGSWSWFTRRSGCRSLVAIFLSACGALTLATQLGFAASTAAASGGKCNDLETLTPGQIRVAILSFMPIIGETDGKLTGLDGENMTLLAKELGCEISVSVTDSAGALAAVQAHRVDATIGSWGWTKERARAGLFTDPLYYQPVVMAQRKGADISKVSQLTGHQLCTLTGFVFIPAMHQVPQASVSTYPTIAAMLLDIQYSRCDVGFGNPLVIPYAEAHNPELKDLSYEYLDQPTASELSTAPLFGGIHRDVGPSEQVIGIGGVGAGVRDPDRCPNEHFAAVDHERFSDGVEETLGHDRRVFGGGLVENDREFVSTESGDRVAVTDGTCEPCGDLDEQQVPAVVAEGVVGHLEAVEVTEQHRDRRC